MAKLAIFRQIKVCQEKVKLVTLTSDGVGSKFCRVDRQQTLRLITNTDRDRSDTDTTIIETSNQTVNDGLLIALRQRVDGGSFIMNKHFSRGAPLNSNGRTDRRTTEFPWLPKLWKNAVVVAGYGKWWFALLDDNNSLQPVASTAAVA